MKRPNIIFVLTDDQGYNDLSIQGSREINTPNIDMMAEQGIRMTNFHTQPVCGPARASLMTGCYPQRLAQIENNRIGCGGGHPLIHNKEVLLPEILKGCGYSTAMLGKWHLGMTYGSSPTEKGFDYFLGTTGSNDGPWLNLDDLEFAEGVSREMPQDSEFNNTALICGKTVVEFPMIQTGITTRYTDKAIEQIEAFSKQDNPFFLYIAHNMPHIPLHPSKEFLGKSKYGLYGDCVEEIDYNMGRIMKSLEDNGVDDNTIVIYTSDNGPWLLKHLIEKRHCGSAWPLRNGKVTSWEGGTRVPFIAWMPNHIPAGQISSEFAASIDLMPTLVKLAGGEMPTDRVIDGCDIWDILTATPQAAKVHDEYYFYVCRNLQAVKKGDWKLILPIQPNIDCMMKFWEDHLEYVEKPQLYYMPNDMSEKNDLSEKYPDVVEQLLKLAEVARKDLGEGYRVGEGERFFEDMPVCSTHITF